MRKFLKNSILEIFTTIYDTHEMIKNLVEEKNLDAAVSALQECQDTAIRIGTIIEEAEGEGFISVSYLEEYCEEVYKVAQNLAAMSGNEGKKLLNQKLIQAEHSVRMDVKVKLEVVFCPYKASMWDSLESVWKTEKDDPDCDVYVVPIPYYDRNPDKSFGAFHYEGGEYPDYVPITHYEAYHFEKRRPDRIYIHNPYDASNFVTSVDPRFYSGVLKKYTDELVYIPYFILPEPNPDNPAEVQEISHFVLTSGVLNANKVIVQSEAMRKVYIKVLLEQIGDTVTNRTYLENKIIGTGSPKLVKISDAAKEEMILPKQWKKVISKPNGERKKVIFYNNSVRAFLEYDVKMLKKISNVLEFFSARREEVALLWRPHPLMEATIKSMRPGLWDGYKKIVDQYMEEAWGIYDDSSDLDRAIVLSDAYYGDLSSVVVLFQNLKKPVMIQNVNCGEVNG